MAVSWELAVKAKARLVVRTPSRARRVVQRLLVPDTPPEVPPAAVVWAMAAE